MSYLPIIVVALIVIGITVWRIHRLVSFFKSGRSVWYKAAVGVVLVVGLAGRISRTMGASDGDVATAEDSTALIADADEDEATDSAHVEPAEDPAEGPSALIAQGEAALVRCDTVTANSAFHALARVGVDLMNADSLAGTPLFLQGVALAGLHDSVNAKVLATEADRLDRQRRMPETATRAALMQRVITLAAKRCSLS